MKWLKLFLVFLIVTNFTLYFQNTFCQWIQKSDGMGNNKNVYSFVIKGNKIFAATGNSGVYYSTNNGNNWSVTSLINKGNCLFVNNNDIFVGAGDGIYKSTNDGFNWAFLGLNNESIWALGIIGNNIFAGADYAEGIFYSSNYGNNWIQSINNHYVLSIAVKGNNVFAGCLDYNGGVLFSTNYGLNWIRTPIDSAEVVCLAVAGDTVFAGTDNDGLFYSINNGANWIPANLNPNLIGGGVLSVAISGNNIFVGTRNGVFVSTNRGISWIQKNQGMGTLDVYSLLITNQYIFAGTYNNSVWRRDISDIIGIKNISKIVPSEFKLFQNYPNPFNPSTNILFNIPHNKFVKIVVYNLLGKEVSCLVNEYLIAGTYEVKFTTAGLPSGIYFYKIITTDFKDTKKMVIIK